MNRKLTYNVFLAQQTDDRNRYEIYLSGKESGTIITKHDVMKILSAVQYSEFEKGTLIFELSKKIIDPYLKNQLPPDPRKRWKVQ